jgi:phosphatidylserine decarboxylase
LISFIGALNVGSIKINFDEELKTNLKRPLVPYINDKNYMGLFELLENNKVKIPIR